MARLLIGIILLWGGLAIWINRNTEPLPSESQQNIRFLLAVSRPEPDPNTSINEQMQQAQTLDFMSFNEPVTDIPSEIRYFINLRSLLYIKRGAITRNQSYLRLLKNLEHVDICPDSKADIRAKEMRDQAFGWLPYGPTEIDEMQQYLPFLQSANYCAYRTLFG